MSFDILRDWNIKFIGEDTYNNLVREAVRVSVDAEIYLAFRLWFYNKAGLSLREFYQYKDELIVAGYCDNYYRLQLIPPGLKSRGFQTTEVSE